MTLEDRFWAKVDRTGDCWLWTGALSSKGYGRFRVSRSFVAWAHRFAYESALGEPVPEGMTLDHTCGTKSCVREHEYTDENTRIDRNGTLHCRACDRSRTAA